MQIHLEENEPINEFRLSEFVYNLCENLGISAEATAKMIIIQTNANKNKAEKE